jgi:hypothetical protein
MKMTATAKRKPVPPIPTLEERVVALMEELEDALDALAEARRPKGESGIPQPLIRRMMNARGYGDCLCNTYRAAIKEN